MKFVQDVYAQMFYIETYLQYLHISCEFLLPIHVVAIENISNYIKLAE